MRYKQFKQVKQALEEIIYFQIKIIIFQLLLKFFTFVWGKTILPENYIVIFLGHTSIHNIYLDIFKTPLKHFIYAWTGRQVNH